MTTAIDWLRDNHDDLIELFGPTTPSSDPSSADPHDDPHRFLEVLAQAVRSGQPALFHDAIAWAKAHRAQHGGPVQALRDGLERLLAGLEERAPEHAAQLVPPVAQILACFDALPTEPDGELGPSTTPHAALAQRYLDLLLEGRRREAIAAVLGAIDEGLSIHDVYLGVFQPVQYEIGRRWQLNQITIAQEHLCTATTQLIMSQLYPRLFNGAPPHHCVVVACVSGDLHEIGARFLADFFEMEGWDACYAGANLPTDGLVEMVEAQQADVLAVSATMVHHVDRVREAIAAVRASRPRIAILVGGYPFMISPDLYKEIGADGTAANAKDAVTLANQLVAS
ncbi:MAG: cobalamin-dependent protein [Myxococcota bacterium]